MSYKQKKGYIYFYNLLKNNDYLFICLFSFWFVYIYNPS